MRKPSPASGSGPSEAGLRRGPTPCCTKVGLKRGPWTPEEDQILASFVRREGEGRWRTLPKRAGLLRCGKSCRLRWMNYLRPSIKHGHITADEEDLILRLHRLLGNRWSLIAGRIPGRTDNEIKNYWNTHLSKKLISQGIDPRTHKPLNSIPDHKLKEPASVTAPVPYPNPNPNPKSVSPYPEEADGNSSGVVLHDHQNNYSDGLDGVPDKGWQSLEGFSLMGFQGSHGGNSNEEYGGLDCCTDDIFSSFLDSLINEDMFLKPHQKQQQQQQNIDQNEPIDYAVASATGFAIEGHWEAGFTSSATLCEDVQGQFIDHAGKHS